MRVTLLDTATGNRHETGDDCDPYWWAEGNGSCDCNRRPYFGVERETLGEVCEGSKRFLIVAASDDQYSLRELNDGYPIETLMKFNLMPKTIKLRFTKGADEREEKRPGDVFDYRPWPYVWRGMTETERVAKGIFVHCNGHGDFEVFRTGDNVEIVN